MLEMSGPEIDLDKLLARVRAEVSERSAANPPPKEVSGTERKVSSAQNAEIPQPIQLKLAPERGIVYRLAFQAPANGRHSVKDLLKYHDRDFVHAAYRAILQRAPDEEGMANYLAHLREGMPRLEVLEALQKSSEAIKVNAQVAGLSRELVLLRMSRWRLIGPIVRLLMALRDLPNEERRRRALEGQIIARIEEGQLNAQEAHRSLNSALREVAEAYRRLLAYAGSKPGRTDVHQLEEVIARVTDTLAAIRGVMDRKADAAELARVGVAVDDISAALGALESTKADQVSLAQTRELLIGALEARPERHELTVVANQLIAVALAKFSGDVLAPLEQDYSALRRRYEADHARFQAATHELKTSLETARADIQQVTETAAADVRSVIATLALSKADCTVVDELRAEVREGLDAALTNLRESLRCSSENLQSSLAATQAALREAVEPLRSQAHDLKHNLLDQERRVSMLLEEARKRLPAPIAKEQLHNMVTERRHLLDATYAQIESRFRGTRADIKQRAALYIPYLRAANAGQPRSPVLDLGCGRGEWLELLRDEALVARGVDMNRIFLNACRDMDLDVVEGDILEFLRSLKPASIGAVTAMHLLEHLPVDVVIALLDESLRVLKPGGLIIIEAPNPENLQVGACNFYADPTHCSPMPPILVEALVEQRGFVRPSIIRPARETAAPVAVPTRVAPSHALASVINPLVDVMLTNFFVSPDYSVIATKA